jgi:hypothetical protein
MSESSSLLAELLVPGALTIKATLIQERGEIRKETKENKSPESAWETVKPLPTKSCLDTTVTLPKNLPFGLNGRLRMHYRGGVIKWHAVLYIT